MKEEFCEECGFEFTRHYAMFSKGEYEKHQNKNGKTYCYSCRKAAFINKTKEVKE